MEQIKQKVTHRCCPKCGDIINQTMIDLMRYAMPCARGCEGVTTNDFQPMYMSTEERVEPRPGSIMHINKAGLTVITHPGKRWYSTNLFLATMCYDGKRWRKLDE